MYSRHLQESLEIIAHLKRGGMHWACTRQPWYMQLDCKTSALQDCAQKVEQFWGCAFCPRTFLFLMQQPSSRVRSLNVCCKTFTTCVGHSVTKLVLCTSRAAGHIHQGGINMYFVLPKTHKPFSYFTLFSTERSFGHVNHTPVCLYFCSQQPLQA